MIQLAVREKEWKPIKLSRDGPPISHLFFANDLFLYGEASLQQKEVTLACLNLLCEASGGLVSKAKTRLFVSKNVNHSWVKELSQLSGFMIPSDIGKYLGVPILYSRQTCSTYSYIMHRARKRLSSWKIGCLAMAGRITLAQSILAALPSYTMQTVLLPKRICRRLEQMTRNFVCGAKPGERTWHSIAWGSFCKP